MPIYSETAKHRFRYRFDVAFINFFISNFILLTFLFQILFVDFEASRVGDVCLGLFIFHPVAVDEIK